MREMFLVEYGSSYSSDPFDPKCVCFTENDAQAYIKLQSLSKSLYHTSKLPVYGEDNREYHFILNFAKNSDDFEYDLIFGFEHLRCLWTAYCLRQNLKPYEEEYDEKIKEIWDRVNDNAGCLLSEFSYGRFYANMSKFFI